MNEPNWKTKSWEEAFRLLQKFCPRSKKYFNHPNKLSLDPIYDLIFEIDPDAVRKSFVRNESRCSELIKALLGKSLEKETGRVLIIPDLGNSYEEPFVCKATSLIFRIDEGKKPPYTAFIGGYDLLIVFESSGRLLYFDHEDGYVITKNIKDCTTSRN